ncbi:AMP-binding protein [Plantactinospora sp. GCM10030261]|uniref:AMP-binding protein n=1 Tax=Plantactinospora sp. GCM10030261 TaxID=3273420 RepID=UPI0036187D38
MTRPRVAPVTAPVVPFVRGLAAHGTRPALITGEGTVSYRELADRVAATARRLGPERRLVQVVGGNTVQALVAYLGALAGGHAVLLVPDGGGSAAALAAAYDPDVILRPATGSWLIDERRPGTAHDLHPDLALLLSTSGSTGSPKLVRLSAANLTANAEAIADYLGIRPDDRAATTLPMHYCYGLSVIHSHLLRGAGLIMTGLSVADTCFWDLFRAARGTTFAGVPYTFDLLDRVGFADLRLPHLRYVTQAGGRLAPDRVARYAALGRRAGWDLYVMYGQTEATARMAYLPPDLASVRPEAIGVPIPGGSFALRPVPEVPADTGELVYTGPNVMLGYAERPADLALGRTVHELRTGDLARRSADSLYEIVGRRSQFAKIAGLRVDPQQVETVLGRHGVAACCVGGDGELLVAVTAPADPATVRRTIVTECALPARAVAVATVAELPRLPNGKPDHRAVRDLVRPAPDPAGPASVGPGSTSAGPGAGGRAEPARSGDALDRLCRLYAEVLDTDDVTPESSFVSLGGDSLSYVEMSLRLEQELGGLPPSWHTRPIRELCPAPAPDGDPTTTPRTRIGRRRVVETSVALRAIAIVLIVGTHAALFNISGGAHVLLGVAGFNFARFQLTTADRRDRLRHVRTSVLRIAVPSVAWIAVALLVLREYGPANLVLLGGVFGAPDDGSRWHFWFVEAIVHILVVAAVLLAVPAVDRAERRWPFGVPMAVLGLALAVRFDLFDLRTGHDLPATVRFGWLFAIGWAAARAGTRWRRLLVTVAILGTVPGMFDDVRRESVIVAGLVLLVWVPSLPSLASLNRVAGILAGASLYVYLTHWQVYPLLVGHSAVLAVAASLAVGIGYGAVATAVGRRLPTVTRRAGGEKPGRLVGKTQWPVRSPWPGS